MKTFALCTLFLLTCTFLSQVSAGEFKGKKISIGKGHAYSFVNTDSRNLPTTVGIALTIEALEDLPLIDTTYILKLPSAISIPPYEEIMVNWNVYGHEPTNIYGIPHFDFHFYLINDESRSSIMCTGEDAAICTKRPEADYIAPFYIPTPDGVPMMGWHWLDSLSPELNGKRFTSTFIYGYYDAEMIFLEPMITREFLLNKVNIDQVLALPLKYAINGYYPKKYKLNYDSNEKLYRIVLDELVLRDTNK